MTIKGDADGRWSRALNGAGFALICTAALLTSACGGGSSGNEVTIGSGQDQDPVVLDFPVFYVKRPVPTEQMAAQFDLRRLRRFEVGADLFMRDRASPTAAERNLTTSITEGLGDVRDVEVNYEGTKVVFAMRAQFIEDADEEDQPTWNIWEYDIAAANLRRVISDDNVAEEGHDVAPHYLPDGRIVFSSTRQRQSRAVLTDEGKTPFSAQDEDNREPGFVLHVMRADGTDIKQISFNQSHDRDPSVLSNGQIVFSRWDNFGAANEFNLYRMNPDGRGLELLYGTHSHATGTVDPETNQPSVVQFLEPRLMPDGRMLTIARPFTGTEEGGDLLLIDTERFVENNQPTLANANLSGPAQERALPTDVRTIPGPSPGGRYRSAFPLFDGTNRLLVSWSQCRLLEEGRVVPCTADRLSVTDPEPVEAPTLFGVYIYDTTRDTQQPVVPPQEGFTFTEVVAASPRTAPPVILDGASLTDPIASANMGVLHIRSVYDFDGVYTNGPAGVSFDNLRNPSATTWTQRRARFLRIEKAVSLPNNQLRQVPNSNFGPGGRGRGMSEIVGYAPIEPDGSVRVAVPANVALSISFTDVNGRRFGPRHTNWLQVTPGEVRECSGCHSTAQPLRAHGRAGLFQALNAGAAADGSFTGANPLLSARVGETMAQTRNRTVCANEFCKPSVNLVFNDFWAATPAARAASFDACYRNVGTDVIADELGATHVCASGITTVAMRPTTEACERSYSSLCRITIHYPVHIHPLWSASRTDLDGDMVPDFGVDPVTMMPVDRSCISCHTTQGANNTVQVPAGQLDLMTGPSDDNPDQEKAYRELLFGDRALVLNAMGQLEEECLVRDPETNVCTQFRNVGASMNGNAGANSSSFFGRFAVGGTHAGYLTPAELRLLSEWVDIGAQYYNDPFLPVEN